jgi:hypothetical protein
MYHNEVDWLKIRKNLKFAQFPVDILPFPDHPFFAVNCDYPRFFCKFSQQNLYKINGYNIPVGHQSTLLTWDRRKQDRLRLHWFIYKQLFKHWVHLPHMGHFIQPYKVHSLPVLVIQRRKQRFVRRFLQKARKTQSIWLMKQPKWIKNRRFSFIRIIYMDLRLIDNFQICSLLRNRY